MSPRLLLLLSVLLVLGCAQKTVGPAPGAEDKRGDAAPTGNMRWVAYDEVTDLAVGQSLGVRKTETTFTFSRVLTDSRCPTGLDCFRAGEAVLLITLPGGGTQRVSVPADGRAPARFSVPGGNGTIRKLSPYPEGQEKINPDNYVLTVKVGKASVD